MLIVGLTAWGGLCLSTGRAVAHEVFTEYVQHRVGMTVGAGHIDVTVQLTFFESGSELERSHMDSDGDGRLSQKEVKAYLEKLEVQLDAAVTLRVGTRKLALIPLRAPEIDLLGQEHVGRGHHCLTLSYFARTPTGLEPGKEFVIEDRLWPEFRALGSIQAEGQDGCRIEARPVSDPVFPPLQRNEARVFKARLLAPPAKVSNETDQASNE